MLPQNDEPTKAPSFRDIQRQHDFQKNLIKHAKHQDLEGNNDQLGWLYDLLPTKRLGRDGEWSFTKKFYSAIELKRHSLLVRMIPHENLKSRWIQLMVIHEDREPDQSELAYVWNLWFPKKLAQHPPEEFTTSTSPPNSHAFWIEV